LTVTDWEMAASRLRHGVMPYQQLIADCNPAGPNHWLKRRCDDGKTLMLISRHEDNPWLYDIRRGDWTPHGRAYLARLEQLTGVRRKRLLLGEWAAEVEGALWNLDQIEEFRVPAFPAGVERVRVVVAVDPPGSHDGAECGIVVVARGSDGHLYILDDLSRRGTPLEWATAAVGAYDKYEADAVVIEVNQGGEMATETLRRVRRNLPVRPVRATRGKIVRAEPVSALAAQGRIHHVGRFPALEDQLASWVPGQPSPDRLDALVWAVTDLMQAERSGPVFSWVAGEGANGPTDVDW
jgi:phage terminase large subunit-like protein